MTRFEELYTSGKYLERNPTLHVEESAWKAKYILRLLARNQAGPKTVSEVGCGAGEVLKQLQKNMDSDCEFWGYEISAYAFDMCRSRANSRLHFRLGDICQDQDAYFDLMLVLDVLEHLEDYFSFLRAIKSKARYKAFHIPLDLSVQTLVRQNALLKRRDMYAHIHYFSRDTAVRTLEDMGYEILDTMYTPRSVELGTEPIQKLLTLPRKFMFAQDPDRAARFLGGYSLLVLAL